MRLGYIDAASVVMWPNSVSMESYEISESNVTPARMMRFMLVSICKRVAISLEETSFSGMALMTLELACDHL